jgi:TetR/AcrR family transcriptional regulator, mexJK operon transcriptional repressor
MSAKALMKDAMVAAGRAQPEGGGVSPSPKVRQILRAAKDMFLEHGFGAASMDAIVQAAGVSKATVYAHFSSKEELFAGVVEAECRSRFDDFTIGDTDPRDPAAVLRGLAYKFLDLVLSPEALAVHRIILAETGRFPELGRIFWKVGPERVIGEVSRYLARADAAGALSVPEPRLAAEQFLSLLKVELHLRRLLNIAPEPGEITPERVVDAAVGLFLRGYAAPRAPQ